MEAPLTSAFKHAPETTEEVWLKAKADTFVPVCQVQLKSKNIYLRSRTSRQCAAWTIWLAGVRSCSEPMSLGLSCPRSALEKRHKVKSVLQCSSLAWGRLRGRRSLSSRISSLPAPMEAPHSGSTESRRSETGASTDPQLCHPLGP